eukprot:gene17780-21210_t
MRSTASILFLLFFFATVYAQQRHYTGAIGTSLIEFQADLKGSEQQSALYLYKNVNTPIYLEGSLKNSVCVLYETDNKGNKTASFSFMHFDIESENLTGTWKDLLSGKELPVWLKKDDELSEGNGIHWANKTIIQIVSLEKLYFKTILSKTDDDFYPRVKGLEIIDKKTNKVLQQINMDCQPMGFNSLAIGDYNFDGYTDLSIFESSYAGANTSSLYFLYDPRTKKYYRSNISGVSLDFDPKTKTITEFNECCAGTEHSVTTYKWVNKKMLMVKRHSYYWDEKKQDFIERKKPKLKKRTISQIELKFVSALLFCYVTLTANAVAQFNSTSYKKGKILDSLRKVYSGNRDQREALRVNWQQQSRKTGDEELLAFTEVLALTAPHAKTPKLIKTLGEKIEKKYAAFPNVQAMYYQIIGYHYFLSEINYEKAFDAYLKLEKVLDNYGPNTISNYAKYCTEIASAYYKFKNYKKAIELDKKGVVYAANQWDFYNTIGLCYMELHHLDSAIYYLQKAVKATVSKKEPDIYRTISLGNIGYAYYLQKKHQSAKPFINADLEGALKIKDSGLSAGAEIPLADIYLTEKNWGTAAALLDQARKHIAESKQQNRLEKFFPVKSRYYQMTGQEKLALAYRDSTIQAIKHNDSIFNGLLVMRVQQRTDMEKLAEEKNKLESYKKLSQTRILALIATFIFVLVVFLLIRRYQSQIEKNKKRIEELNQIIELRQRLSADMHDDIGSTLSSISLYAHSLLLQTQDHTHRDTLEKIKQNTQNVQESIGDIIWSVNPNMDAMEQVVARMRAFGADMAEHAEVAFYFHTYGEVALLSLEMGIRKNLYLIYKEAVSNAIKYSKCRQLKVSLKNDTRSFTMEIRDDGMGFDPAIKHLGNGLLNMQRRTDEVRGRLEILSVKQSGTTITLIIPVLSNG